VTTRRGPVDPPARWAWRCTGRGAATLGLGAALVGAGGVWRYPAVIALGAALLVVAGLGLASTLRRSRLDVHRSVRPLEVPRFSPCGATLRVTSAGGLLPLSVDAVEHTDGRPRPIVIGRLAPRRTTEVTYAIPTQRRGVLTVGPLTVRHRSVAGFAESATSLGGTVEVRVLPRVLPVRGLPSGVTRGHTGADERVEHGGTDLVGLREYVPGDDLRRLHWATSARLGSLMVREDADPSQAYLTVLLDDRAGSFVGGDIEEAVEVAASLAVAAINTDHGLRLLTVCEQIDLIEHATTGERGNAMAIVSGLAEIQARDADRPPAPVPPSARDVVVAVTGHLADLGPLLSEVGAAAVGVVAVVDPRLGHPGVTGGAVTVLRGATSGHLLAAWDKAVVGAPDRAGVT
jgi:uncharacterized protein (DUF58 family)